MFNDYMWKTYLDAGGREVAGRFERFLTGDYDESYVEFIKELQRAYCPSKFVIDHTAENLLFLLENLKEGAGILPEGEYNIISGMDALYSFLQQGEEVSAKQVFDLFSGGMVDYTTALAVELNELFVPYYFQWNFNILEKIAQEFGIELLPIPKKKDYEDRFYYYAAICSALYDFREAHGMSPFELCAFLYDFAPKYIGGVDSYVIKDLPAPKSAYFIGGSRNDRFNSKEEDALTPWQCNPETKAGDMIVMYLRTPISAVDSVWRSVSVGFDDPFFYYYRCTYIANPVGIRQITQKELQADAIFKDLPIVRKNMQGINGVELPPSAYNHLMDWAKADVPKLQYDIEDGDLEIVNEKDVENKRIKPLLKELGYSPEDYAQQMYLEIGNHNHMLIPDFVLLPVSVRGHQSTFAIVEAKNKIPNQKEFEEVRIQARSYAVQLKAKYSVIASRDRVMVSADKDDFAQILFDATWAELKMPDVFHDLYKLIGKKK